MVLFSPHKHTCLLLAPGHRYKTCHPSVYLSVSHIGVGVLMGKPLVLGLHLRSGAFLGFVITLSLSGRRET